MFCPQCGAENSLEQKYCRRCGLQLTAARISLQGGAGEALKKHKKGEVLLSSGAVTLVIFIIAAVTNIFLDSGPVAVLINLLLGLGIAVPLMTTGFLQLRSAGQTLNPKNEPRQLAADQSSRRELTPSAYSTDGLLSPIKVPDSVTEQTTLHLKSPAE